MKNGRKMGVYPNSSSPTGTAYCTVSVTEPEAPFAVALIVVVPVATNMAIPVPAPMVATFVSEDVQEATTVEPLFDAEKFTAPELSIAVKLLEPWEVHPEQEMVKPAPPPIITCSPAVPLWPL